MNDATLNSWSMTINDLTPGAGPPNYLWSNGATTEDLTGLTGSNGFITYTVTATDDNMCTVSQEIDIWCPVPPSCNIVIDAQPSCAGICDGEATLIVNFGSSPPFTVLWDSGEMGTVSAAATGTAVSETQAFAICGGAFTVSVTDNDGVVGTCSTTMPEPDAVIAAITNFTDPLCNGSTDGNIEVTYGGGTSSYEINWSSSAANMGLSAGTNTENNLSDGTYTVVITDASNCTVSAEHTLNEPTAVTVTADGTDPTCFGFSDGTVTAITTGGTSGYVYSWTSLGTDQNYIGVVSSGTYTVISTDINGCTATDQFQLFDPTLLTASISGQADPLCNGESNGEMTANGLGGTEAGMYNYVWSAAFQTDQTVTNLLGATNYTVTVTDDNNCTATATDILVDPAAIVASSGSTPSICGLPNGSAWIDSSASPITGGVPPFTLLWEAAAGGGTNYLANRLSTGNYAVTITDANNCELEVIVNVIDPSAAVVNWTIYQEIVTCNGFTDAFAEIEIVSGSGDFSIAWSAGTPVGGTSGVTTGLYSSTGVGVADSPLEVVVTDDNGCTTILSLPITEPGVIDVTTSSTNPLCFGVASLGTLQATTIGGTGDPTLYLYQWDNSLTVGADHVGTVAVTGTVNYVIEVTDDNGCTGTATDQLVEPTPVVSAISKVDATCFESCDGTVDLETPTGGTGGSYTFLWSPDGETSEDLIDKCEATYSVTVYDGNLCTAIYSIDLVDPTPVVASAATDRNATCDATGFNGDISASGRGGTGGYTFLWDAAAGGVTDDAVIGVNNQTYCVSIYDDYMCRDSTCTEVLGYPSHTWIDTIVDVLCYGNTTGSIDLSLDIIGNGAPFTFEWDAANPSAITASIGTNLLAGTYPVTISDELEETFIRTYIIAEPTAPLLTFCSGTAPLCYNDTNGFVSNIAEGGTIPYTYLWNTGSIQTSPTDLGAGTYQVEVTDNNGCTITCSHILVDPAELTVTLSGNKPSECGTANGELTANPLGGTGAYSYRWLSAINDDVVSPNNLSNGINRVTVTDDNGCTAMAQDELIDPNAPIITIVIDQHVQCNSGNDGQVTINISGGDAPYNYLWTSGNSDAGVVVGDYTEGSLFMGEVSVTVTDAQSCVTVKDTLIDEPTLLTTRITSGVILCYGYETAQIHITGIGGTEPYTFLWDDTDATATDTVFKLGTGTYNVIVTDDNDCSTTNSTFIDPLTPIVANLSHDTVTCYEACDGNLYASATGGTSNFTYKWFFPNPDSLTTPSVFSSICGNNQNDSTYWVIVKDENLCFSDTIFKDVIRPDLIRAHIQIDGAATGSTPFEVVLVDSSYGNYYNTWQWTIDEVYEGTNIDTILYTFETRKTRSFEVVLRASRDGFCEHEDVTYIVVEANSSITIPDVFTPNGDDYNDKFMVTPINICELNGRIFNRWGEKLHEWDGVETGWDGRTLSGEEVPDGVYFYLIDAKGCDDEEYFGNKGTVTIIR